jgi:thymidylate synthase (FAD)
MKLIEPSVKIEYPMSEVDMMGKIELCGRTCYKSEDKITPESRLDFFRMIVRKNHLSVLEHVSITARFITDRAMTHELVRHRHIVASQESQRYCNYGGKEIEFIIPWWHDRRNPAVGESEWQWECAARDAEERYNNLLKSELPPQEARTVLPNSTKTEIVVTANLREWIYILNLRTSHAAHPEMRKLMGLFVNELKKYYPNIIRILLESKCLDKN